MNNNDIEEDIEILEKLRKYFIFNTSGFLDRTREEQKRTAYAINNILTDRERLKKENTNWEKYDLEKEEETTQLNNKLFEAEAKANKYDRLVERIKEVRNSLEKDGFIGYADEIIDILEEE